MLPRVFLSSISYIRQVIIQSSHKPLDFIVFSITIEYLSYKLATMYETSYFVAKSINSSENFNWVFMTDWVLALLASLTILFYFNRAIAFILSYLMKLVIWKRYKIRIKLQSFKISYLAGRVFFKNLIVITENEIIMIHQGWFTWQYWLQQTRSSGLLIDGVPDVDPIRNEKLPARFLLEAYGFEVFMYNRNYAYDNIIEQLAEHDIKLKDDKEVQEFLRNRKKASECDASSSQDPDLTSTSSRSETTESERELSSFLKMMPIQVIVKKGAFIMGNETTTSLFMLSYTKLTGVIDVLPAASPLDYFRIAFNLNAESLQIYLKPNVSFKSPEIMVSELVPSRKHFEKIRKWFRFPKRHASKLLRRSNSGGTVETSHIGETEIEDSYDDDEYWYGLERYLTSTSSN
ncbi:unnamed protein product [Ambrosiozyma monospora]|uniref:Unnamed protein product n=1 Tax=Ambrosiozyma monospora TaxID=43982 RepID=A0ACB5TX06_AMBMO|nr:unnamed protein product [Ambrosiozyma monospora]